MAQARALVGSELWQVSEEERNAAVFEQNRGRDLGDVLAESRHVFEQYLQALDALSQEDLHDARRFQALPDGWQPWHILYDLTQSPRKQ